MKNKIFLIIFALMILSGVGLYIFSKNSTNPTIQGLPLDEDNVVIKAIEGSNLAVEGDGEFKVETIELDNKKINNEELALLGREVAPAGNIDKDVASRALEKIKELSMSLKEDPENVENWLELGMYRKAIGDYEGAAEIWEYTSTVWPKNSVSLNNLGDLYAYYIKNATRAEEYFLQAIKNEPSNMYSYFKIVDFYRDISKDMYKARAILEQGITANPNTSQDLQNLLISLE